MSIVPFSGHRPSLYSRDTFNTVVSAGRTLRKFYDWYNSISSDTRVGMPSRQKSGRRVRGSANTIRSTGIAADLAVNPPSQRIPNGVPKQVSNQVVWDVVKVDSIINALSTGIVETNFSFSLQTIHPQAAQWIALFDQWCIPQVEVEFRSEQAPGATAGPAQLYTALDFDSVGSLGSVAAIEDFATCHVKSMFPQASERRAIRPTNKLSVQQTTGPNVNGNLDRAWCDSAVASTQWLGIRSIVGTTTSAYSISVTVNVWFAFRNQI
jgi:hypothetical protein